MIFVANVRTVLLANQDIKYRYFFNNSLLTLPDGMPLVWMARLWGLKNVQRVCGPELFVSMLCNPKNGIKHFLIGDTQETLAKIEKKYVLEKETNKALIVGYYSPPFCDLDEYDYKMIADKINNSNADVVWTALRSPKQDLFNSRLFPYIDDKICIGVGAAFRFAIGDYRNPPAFFKKIGATGFFWRKINFQMLNLYLKYSFEILGWSFKIIFQRLKHAR